MNKPAFNAWCDYHFAAFRGVETWLSRMDDDGKATLEHWFKTLENYSQQDCRSATDELHRDPTDIQFDRHPALIASMAYKHWQRRQPTAADQRPDSRRASESDADSWTRHYPHLLKIIKESGRIYDAALAKHGRYNEACKAEISEKVDVIVEEAKEKIAEHAH